MAAVLRLIFSVTHCVRMACPAPGRTLQHAGHGTRKDYFHRLIRYYFHRFICCGALRLSKAAIKLPSTTTHSYEAIRAQVRAQGQGVSASSYGDLLLTFTDQSCFLTRWGTLGEPYVRRA